MSDNNHRDDPIITYLEGEKVRILKCQSFHESGEWFVINRRDGTKIRIRKEYVIKVEEPGKENNDG